MKNKKLLKYLKAHFKLTGQRPTPWAVEHGLQPPLVTRALREDTISLKNGVKLAKACHNQVTVLDICPWLAELLPDYKPE